MCKMAQFLKYLWGVRHRERQVGVMFASTIVYKSILDSLARDEVLCFPQMMQLKVLSDESFVGIFPIAFYINKDITFTPIPKIQVGSQSGMWPVERSKKRAAWRDSWRSDDESGSQSRITAVVVKTQLAKLRKALPKFFWMLENGRWAF